jgi:hypothetical protein
MRRWGLHTAATANPVSLAFELGQACQFTCRSTRHIISQAITRGRWLHHTTFLWDFDDAHMALLKHPERAPAYREVGPHSSSSMAMMHAATTECCR